MAKLRDKEIFKVIISIYVISILISSSKFKYIAINSKLNKFININLATLILCCRLFLASRLDDITISIYIRIYR